MIYISRKRCKTSLWLFKSCLCTSGPLRKMVLLAKPLQTCVVKQCRSNICMALFLTSTSQPLQVVINLYLNLLTESNGERIVNEYVRYGFPRVQREHTQRFPSLPRGLLGSCPSSQSHIIQRFLKVSPWQCLQLPCPHGLILFHKLFSPSQKSILPSVT